MDFRQKYILIIQNIYLLLSMNIFGTLSIRTLFEKIFPNENLVKYDPTNVARTQWKVQHFDIRAVLHSCCVLLSQNFFVLFYVLLYF